MAFMMILHPVAQRASRPGRIGMRSGFFDLAQFFVAAHVLVGKPVATFPGHALARARNP
jgi:hypothetical protein